MIIGFTGTREGMTLAQKEVVAYLLRNIEMKSFIDHVSHGDCIGADADFDEIASKMNIVRWAYPSNISSMRAHTEDRGAILAIEPRPPLERNVMISVGAKYLIACTKSPDEQVRSGTWHAVRCARKNKTTIYIVFPDGTLKVESSARAV